MRITPRVCTSVLSLKYNLLHVAVSRMWVGLHVGGQGNLSVVCKIATFISSIYIFAKFIAREKRRPTVV